MKMLFDFQCPHGHTTERLVSPETRSIACGCGAQAERIISPVRAKIDPISGHFPGATMKWARMRQKQIQYEKKADL